LPLPKFHLLVFRVEVSQVFRFLFQSKMWEAGR
jgi:hypothetical protein